MTFNLRVCPYRDQRMPPWDRNNRNYKRLEWYPDSKKTPRANTPIFSRFRTVTLGETRFATIAKSPLRNAMFSTERNARKVQEFRKNESKMARRVFSFSLGRSIKLHAAFSVFTLQFILQPLPGSFRYPCPSWSLQFRPDQKLVQGRNNHSTGRTSRSTYAGPIDVSKSTGFRFG